MRTIIGPACECSPLRVTPLGPLNLIWGALFGAVALGVTGSPANAQSLMCPLEDLEPNAPLLQSVALKVNQSRQAVGYYQPTFGSFLLHAALWTTEGSLNDLDPEDADESRAVDINVAGAAVGFASFLPEVPGISRSRAALWKDGQKIDLGYLDHPGATWVSSWANAINDLGAVVGASQYYVPEDYGQFHLHACIWQNGTISDLGVPPGFWSSEAKDIDINGTVVGSVSMSFYPPNDGNFHIVPHACVWTNGIESELPMAPGDTESVALAINDAGTILGMSGGHPVIWKDGSVTILSLASAQDINSAGQVAGTLLVGGIAHACIWRDGIITDLGTLGGVSSEGYGINSAGDVVGMSGITGYFQSHAFLYTAKNVTIAQPSPGVRWIPEEQHDIQWTSCGISNVKLSYTTGPGEPRIVIPNASSIPASVGHFIWLVPDELSKHCSVRVEDADDPSAFAESPMFTIRGYVLTRTSGTGDYDAYDLLLDECPGPNDAEHFWPSEWWSQFDYDYGIDPFTSTTYSEEFRSFAQGLDDVGEPTIGLLLRQDFPDWPLFVRTFGADECYQAYYYYNPVAVDLWGRIATHNTKFPGSCFGLAMASLMYFADQPAFQRKFPELGPSTRLAQSELTNELRSAINSVYLHQFSCEHLLGTLAAPFLTPRDVLAEMKEILLADNASAGARVINLRQKDPSAVYHAHAVVPYKMLRHPGQEHAWDISVYDGNNPGNASCSIYVDSLQNVWQYDNRNLLGVWFGTDGEFTDGITYIQLSDVVSGYYDKPTFLRLGCVPGIGIPGPYRSWVATEAAPGMLIFADTTLNITASQADTMVLNYSTAGFSVKPPGRALLPITGGATVPFAFNLPAVPTMMEARGRSTGNERLGILDPIAWYEIEHAGSDGHGAMSIQYGSGGFYGAGVGIANADSGEATIRIGTLRSFGNEIRGLTIFGLTQAQSETTHVTITDQGARVDNLGGAREYGLALTYEKTTGVFSRFIAHAIPLVENAGEWLVPDWQDLVGDGVLVLVDGGMDGSIDSVLYFGNELVGVEGTQRQGSSRLWLRANGNPSRGSIRLRFGIPRAGRVVLEVFGVDGKRMMPRISDDMTAGEHELVLDNRMESRLRSGVYFVRMKAGSETANVRVVLIE